MKWHNVDNVSFKRGTHQSLIAQYDNSPYKFEYAAGSTTAGQKTMFKQFGEYIGAKQCTIILKDMDTRYLEDYLEFIDLGTGEMIIRKELPTAEGQKREFKKYTVKDITKWEKEF